MSPELASRLRVLEQQAEAMALQAAALRQQVTALVSEAEASEAAGPALVTEAGPQGEGFYGDFPANQTNEATPDAPEPRRPRRRP